MISSDKGKPMTIFERISDEPCDPDAFIEYMLKYYRAHSAYWAELSNDREPDKPTARECVLHQLGGFIITLENVQQKLARERLLAAGHTAEETVEILNTNAKSPPQAQPRGPL